YRDSSSLARRLPVMRMLRSSVEEIESTSRQLAAQIESDLGEFDCIVSEDESYAGGGALPGLKLATWTVRLSHARISAERLAWALRQGEPPVVARVQDARVVLDCRTIAGDEPSLIVAALGAALRELLES
ncbi:MAG: hypothetical protein JNG88_08420, partial [Phycisphaerales bacterium]|nr:hypothetical protein [Phycisphaerales bacterium]